MCVNPWRLRAKMPPQRPTLRDAPYSPVDTEWWQLVWFGCRTLQTQSAQCKDGVDTLLFWLCSSAVSSPVATPRSTSDGATNTEGTSAASEAELAGAGLGCEKARTCMGLFAVLLQPPRQHADVRARCRNPGDMWSYLWHVERTPRAPCRLRALWQCLLQLHVADTIGQGAIIIGEQMAVA